MTSNRTSLFVFGIAVSLSLSALRAQDAPSPTETRLREALRNTAAQLSDAQNQVVTLQASQAQSDKDNAELKAKVDALTVQVATLTKQSADDKAASDKAIADLNAQVADQTGQISRLNQSLTEWKNAYNQVSQLATAKEEARAQLALQAALLQRTIDDREAKNIALYKTGSEILTRYEKFGLGDAIGAKEPFVGLTRVKLEKLVQDYKDKLLNQTVTSGQPPAPSLPAFPPSTHPVAGAGRESPPSAQPPPKT
jgi:DNA repair exonuclease SbcCD ATPase subunit